MIVIQNILQLKVNMKKSGVGELIYECFLSDFRGKKPVINKKEVSFILRNIRSLALDACRRQETNPNLWNIIGWKRQRSQISKLIMKTPTNVTLTFNS